jgi:hypothetical protein
MMVTTHGLLGLALATPLTVLAPELAPVAAVAGLLGGAIPDLDLFVGRHRRTLHYPVLGWLAAVPAAGLAVLAPGPATVALAVGLAAFALHAAMDALGAADELRPWERTSAEAVYDHLRGRWVRPRYLVRYDGAPEDVLLTALAAVPAVVAFVGALRWLAVGCVVLALGYAAVRRRVPDWIGGYI